MHLDSDDVWVVGTLMASVHAVGRVLTHMAVVRRLGDWIRHYDRRLLRVERLQGLKPLTPPPTPFDAPLTVEEITGKGETS